VFPQTHERSVMLVHPDDEAALVEQVIMHAEIPAVPVGAALEPVVVCALTASALMRMAATSFMLVNIMRLGVM